MPTGKEYPWIEWEIEYVGSKVTEYPDRTDFFRKKGVLSQSIWSKRSLDWDEKRTAALRKSAQRATELTIEKRARYYAKMAETGSESLDQGLKALRSKGLKFRSKGEAAQVAKIGAELIQSALKSDQSAAELLQSLQVEFEVKGTDGVDAGTIRILAKALARAKAGIQEIQPPTLDA